MMKETLVLLSCIFLYLCSPCSAGRWDEYGTHTENVNKKYDAFVKRIEARWGEYLESTIPRWVTYDEAEGSRTQVEFEEGYVEVAVIETGDRQKDEKRCAAVLEKILEHGMPDEKIKTPLLQDQVMYAEKVIGRKEIPETVKDVVKKAKSKQIKGKGGSVLMVRLDFAPDHIKKRASNFLHIVQEYAGRFDLDISLVLAVVHTESFFNPYAKSSVAYGLMQLVPQSGAKDAYRAIYGRNKILGAEYLYNPKNNIELGTKYLSMLSSSFFKGVENEETKLYMAICAYNTGAGNVSKSFTGRKKITPAIVYANNHTPVEIYERLLSSLPYDETKNYLKKVTKRMELYTQWAVP